MKFKEYYVPDEYWFTKDHMWLFIKDKSKVRIGIASTLLKILGPLKNIELPNPGDKIFRAKRMGCLETLKTRVDLFSPLTGTVESVNQAILRDPSVINYSPYREGWLLEIGPSSLDEDLKQMLNAQAYVRYLSEVADVLGL